MPMTARLGLFLFIYWLPTCVFAYVGPGLGLGALGAAIGIVLSIVLALLALVWYPLKRFIARVRERRAKKTTARAAAKPHDDAGPDA